MAKKMRLKLSDNPILYESARTYYRNYFYEKVFKDDGMPEYVHEGIFTLNWSHASKMLDSYVYNNIEDPRRFYMEMTATMAEDDAEPYLSDCSD